MIYVGWALIGISIVYLMYSFIKNPFIYLGKIFKSYFSIFKHFRESIPFTIIPFIIGLGLSFLYDIDISLLNQMIVFISIILSILFSSSGIIVSKNTENNDNEKMRNVVKQTQNLILFVTIMAITLLIIIILYMSLHETLNEFFITLFSFFILSFFTLITLNLFIIIKRLNVLLEI